MASRCGWRRRHAGGFLRASTVMSARRLELKEQEVLLDLLVSSSPGPCRRVVGRPTHPYTPQGRLICALDLPSRRFAAMQGNLVPVTSVPLVYLTDHPPGCGLDIAKGPLLVTRTTNITSYRDYRHETIYRGPGKGNSIYFKGRVTCILHALSRVLGAGALLN